MGGSTVWPFQVATYFSRLDEEGLPPPHGPHGEGPWEREKQVLSKVLGLPQMKTPQIRASSAPLFPRDPTPSIQKLLPVHGAGGSSWPGRDSHPGLGQLLLSLQGPFGNLWAPMRDAPRYPSRSCRGRGLRGPGGARPRVSTHHMAPSSPSRW